MHQTQSTIMRDLVDTKNPSVDTFGLGITIDQLSCCSGQLIFGRWPFESHFILLYIILGGLSSYGVTVTICWKMKHESVIKDSTDCVCVNEGPRIFHSAPNWTFSLLRAPSSTFTTMNHLRHWTVVNGCLNTTLRGSSHSCIVSMSPGWRPPRDCNHAHSAAPGHLCPAPGLRASDAGLRQQ